MRVDLSYEVSGPAGAPTILLAHGLATDREMWADVAALLETSFRVIRYDSRGHGRSPAGVTTFDLADLASDILTLLDREKIVRAHVAGLSMGGMAAMTLALSHADRLDSLIVCDARGDAPEAYRGSWDDRIAKVKSGGVQAVVEPTIRRWFTDAFLQDEAAVERVRAMMLRTSVEGYCRSAEALKGLDCTRHLGSLRLPTLFLVGEQDVGAPIETMKVMHEATPGSQFVVVPEAGHISAMEQPAAVARAILEFLRAAHP